MQSMELFHFLENEYFSMDTQAQSQVPGEASITPQQVQQVAPDTQGQQGQQEMLQKLVGAHKVKILLDGAFKLAAEKTGADFSSRIKDPDTITKKIAQKRMEGRGDYDLGDIRDSYGGRFTVKSKSDIPKIREQIEAMEQAGLFKIEKEEHRKSDVYDAMHFDIRTYNGEWAELQVMTAQDALSSVANHDARAVYNENPNNKAVDALVQKQHAVAHSMPSEKALAVTKALQGLHQQNNNQPLPPQLTASVLAQSQQ